MGAIPLVQRDFSYGELDNIALSGVDTNNYPISLKGASKIKNFFVNSYKGLSRRNGTTFLAESQNNRITRILNFSIGIEESYVIEINKDYIRILNENGIEKNGNNQEIKFPSVYQEQHLKSIYNWAKGGSALYIVHSNYPPYVLRRTKTTSGNIWTFEKMTFKSQLDDNGNSTYCGTPTGVSRFSVADKVELIIVSTTNKLTSNDQNTTPYTFQANVIYRLIYKHSDETLKIAYIKTTTSGTAVDYTILSGVISDNWNAKQGVLKGVPIPLWEIEWGYDGVEYPSCIEIADQRLFFSQGGSIYGSTLSDFTDFGLYENSVSATSSFKIQPYKDNLNQFNYIKEMDGVLYVGTKNEIYRMVKSQANAGVFLSYSANANYLENGSSVLPPIFIDSYFIFLNRDNIRLRVSEYNADSQLIKGQYLNKDNKEILKEGVNRQVFQATPNNLIYSLKNNGEIALSNFSTTADFYYGGWSTMAMEDAVIEDICCIPSKTKNQDIIILVVKRVINGIEKRYIERYNDKVSLFEDTNCTDFLDCSFSVSKPFIQKEINGRKYIGGFNIFKNKQVALVFNDFEYKSLVQVDVDGYLELPQETQNNLIFQDINKITCGFTYESFVKTSPYEIFFDYRYSSIGRIGDINEITLSVLNKTNIEILDRNDKPIYEVPKSFNKDEIFKTKIQTIKTDIKVKSSIYERDKQFSIKIKDNAPYPMTILNFAFNVEI